MQLAIPYRFPATVGLEDFLKKCSEKKYRARSINVLVGHGKPVLERDFRQIRLPYEVSYEARSLQGETVAIREPEHLNSTFHDPQDHYFETPLGMNPPPNPWNKLPNYTRDMARFCAQHGFVARAYLKTVYEPMKLLEEVKPEDVDPTESIRAPLILLL